MLFGLPLVAGTVYFNDFQSAVGPNLSVSSGTLAIVPPHPNCTSPTYCTPFLGIAGPNGPQPLDFHTVSLALTGLLPHSEATVSLALLVLGSWDGNATPSYGPDYWTLAVSGGPTLLDTTFNIAIPNFGQCYPDSCPATYPARTGSVENGTLGWRVGSYDNSLYLLSYSFPHTASTLVLTFQGRFQGPFSYGWPSDEGWGMDNLQVDVSEEGGGGVIPEPGSFALLGSGLVAVVVALRGRPTR